MNKRTIAILAASVVLGAAIYFTYIFTASGVGKSQTKMSGKDSLLLIREIENKILLQDRKTMLKGIDSLMKRAPIVNRYYYYTYDSLMRDAPEQCKSVLETFYAASEKRDSSRMQIINKQDSAIKSDTKIISNFQDIILIKDYNLSLTRDTLADVRFDLKAQKKATRRAKIGGWIKTTTAAAAAIFITSKVK